MKILVNPSAPAGIEAAAAEIAATFDHQGELLHNGRNKIRLIRLDGMPEIVAKRFKRPALLQRLLRLGRPTKGRKAWDAALKMEALGISTPKPYAYAEVSRLECYYLCALHEDKPLADMPQTDENALALAQLFAGLHRAGVLHRDLNNTNIRYDLDEQGKVRFCLIDINRTRFFGRLPALKYRLENMYRWSGDTSFFAQVMEAYLQEMGELQALAHALAGKRLHDARWTRRKAFTRRLKGVR